MKQQGEVMVKMLEQDGPNPNSGQLDMLVSTGFVRPRSTIEFFSAKQSFSLRQRLVQFVRVLAAAAGVVRLAAAFAAHNRRNLLDDFAGLGLGGEFGRDRRNQRHAAAMRTAAEHNHAFERLFSESATACRNRRPRRQDCG